MAVTVTKAAPSGSIDPLYAGSFGAVGSSNFINVNNEAFARKRVRLCRLTLSGTYATGGFALTPSDYGLREIHGLAVVCDKNSTSGAGAVPQLTTTGGSPNVKLYVDDVPTELTNATSVANWRYVLLIVGV